MRDGKTRRSAEAELTAASLCACIEDGRSEMREIFDALSAEELNARASDAWIVGLRAVAVERTRRANKPRTPIRLSSMPPESC